MFLFSHLRGHLHVFKEFTPRDLTYELRGQEKKEKRRLNSRQTHTSDNPTKIISKREEVSFNLEVFIKGTSTRF